MALFRRKTAEASDVPADLQQYYSSSNSGVGRWIVRLIAFLVILALLVWAGIWLYNRIANRDTAQTPQAATSQQTSDAEKKAAEDKAKADAAAKKASDDAKAKAAADAKKAQDEANKKLAEAKKQTAASSGGAVAQAPAPAPAQAPAPAATPAPAPATVGGSGAGTGTGALPNAGPETSLIAGLFGVATVIGTAFHAIFVRRRQSN